MAARALSRLRYNAAARLIRVSQRSTIAITADGIISDPSKLSIEVDISTYHSGEVVLELFAPSGESVGLIKRIGANDDYDCGSMIKEFEVGNKLTFNSANTSFLAFPYVTGNYAPTRGRSHFPISVRMTPLGTFLAGKDIRGAWKIKMYDYNAEDVVSLGACRLNSWKLKFEAGAVR